MPDRYKKIENSPDGSVALYHRVTARQDFIQSARELFYLIREAQERFPGRKRHLYLDIEGHRDRDGKYDFDMVELQSKFLIEFIMPHLTEAHVPIADVKNPKFQDNAIPETLTIFDKPSG